MGVGGDVVLRWLLLGDDWHCLALLHVVWKGSLEYTGQKTQLSTFSSCVARVISVVYTHSALRGHALKDDPLRGGALEDDALVSDALGEWCAGRSCARGRCALRGDPDVAWSL